MYGTAEWRSRGPLRSDQIAGVVIGTAGHIDHGKTSLVRALTGVDPDRLKEEQERGMTIDLGFAPLELKDGRAVGIVDVPGHERFVKNMVAGASGIDLVLLVVAADDGVMPQTREHLEILGLLGLRRGLVVVTKVDRPGVDADLLGALDLELDGLLAGTFLDGARRLRVSSVTREGLPALEGAIAVEVASAAPRPAGGPLRMPVQRVFSAKGFGTVLTGIPVSGAVEPGDEVVVHAASGELRGRVRGLHAYGRPVERARAGHSAALNVADLARTAVERGDVVATPDVFEPGDLWEVRVQALGPSRLPLRTRTTVRVHVGTAEVLGEVVLLDADELVRGGTAFAQLRLRQPIVAAPGDRFVLRRHSPVETVGGGVVLARSRWRLKARRPQVLERLARREAARGRLDDEVALEVEVQESDGTPASSSAIAFALGRPRDDVDEALRGLQAAGRVVAAGRGWLGPAAAARREAAVATLADRVVEALRALHPARPPRAGTATEEVRSALEGDPEADLDAALQRARADGRVVLVAGAGPPLHALAGHAAHLGARERSVAAALQARLRDLGLGAPPRAQLVVDVRELAGTRTVADDVLEHLLAAGQVVSIGDDLIVDRRAYEQAVEVVRRTLARGPATSSEVRIALDASRRHAVALLEHLDRVGLTRRDGNVRTLAE